jgi:hypothetical protein
MASKKIAKKSRARKTSTKQTRVYTYGVPFLSDKDRETVNDQLFKANRYRNKLIEIERSRRAAFRQLRSSICPELETMEKQLDQLNAEYDEARLKLCKLKRNDRDGSEELQRCEELKSQLKNFSGSVKKVRKSASEQFFKPADEEFKARKDNALSSIKAERGDGKKPGPHTIAAENKKIHQEMMGEDWPEEWVKKIEVEAEANSQKKHARKNCECSVGTYLSVETAAEQSFDHSVTDPRFLRYNGEGKIGSQIKGVTLEQALSGRKKELKIELLPDVHIRGDKRTTRNGKRPFKKAAVVRLCLGKKAYGEDRFLDLNFVYHRPMPEDADIKWVYLVVRKVGVRKVYEVQFTIESEQFDNVPVGKGTIAINLGWRVTDDGIVVATTWDGKKSEEIILNNSMREKDRHFRHLLSVSDDLFNEAIDNLCAWKKKHEIGLDEENYKLSSAHQWRAHSKLARVAFAMCENVKIDIDELWVKWRKERLDRKRLDLFASQKELFAWFGNQGIRKQRDKMALYLEWWRRKDEHLINWARTIERKIKLHRREIYRRKAAEWARKYEFVVFEEWDKSKTAQLPSAEKDRRTKQEEIANTIRQFAGVSVLPEMCKNAFGKGRIKKEKPENISRIHFGCGGEAEHYGSKMVRCKKCGRMFDQDLNAAKHLHDRERSSDDKKP